MVKCDEIISYLNAELKPGYFKDYCPNGLQVSGCDTIQKMVSGVTASQALIDAAVMAGAQLILVHHGYFWKGEDPCITGYKRKRLATLLAHDINLVAYHLPLDAHPTLGNNVCLANELDFPITGTIAMPGNPDILFYGDLAKPISPKDLSLKIEQVLQRKPAHVDVTKKDIKRIAWCTGAAQGFIEAAARGGADAYISGEISEQTLHLAREYNVHYFAAGHHATERYGVQAVAKHVCQHFPGLVHNFIDIANFV